jgi:hypothetical protein
MNIGSCHLLATQASLYHTRDRKDMAHLYLNSNGYFSLRFHMTRVNSNSPSSTIMRHSTQSQTVRDNGSGTLNRLQSAG